MVYFTLFIVALLSGSLLPLGSEGLLIYDLKEGYNPLFLWLSASLGNTFGALINYFMGLKGEEFLEKKGLLNPNSIKKAKERFKRYGTLALLLSPLPIIGDPITFIAGVLGYNLRKFIIIVFIAKSFRYLLIILAII